MFSNKNIQYFKSNKYQKVSLNLLKDFLRESIIFVVFWFLNGLIPILICLISASINQYGAYFVLGIGYITAFQLAYVQIGWVVSIAILYVIKRMAADPINSANYKKLYFNAFITMSIIAFGLIPLFFGPSFIYNYFANNHVNTIISQKIAENYIYGLLIYISVNVIISFITMNIHTKHGLKLSLPILIGSNIIIIGLCAILTLLVQYNNIETHALMIGMSISIGSLISLILLIIISWFFGDIRNLFQKFDSPTFKFLFKSIFKQAASVLSIQVIKGIVLIGLGIAISATMNMTSPMGYQLSRVVWYNYLYLIPFLGYGLGDAMMFYGMRKNITTSFKNLHWNVTILIIMTIILQIGIAIALYFTIEPLSSYYVQHKEIDWSYINLNDIDLIYTINFIATKLNLTQSQLDRIINLINWCNKHPTIGEPILNAMKIGIVQILSNNNMTGSGLSSYLLLNNKAYIYISIYSVCYSSAILINNITLSSKHRYSNTFETIFLIIMQAIVISSVVAMGVELQSTSKTFPYLDAWSFPLAVAGAGAFIMYIVIYLINVNKIKKQDKNKIGIYKINTWNQNPKDIVIDI